MSRRASVASRCCRAGFAFGLVLGLALPAHADGWVVKSVPELPGGRSRCMLESPRQVIDDGYTPTPVSVRVAPGRVLVVTESDIDLSFRDVGLRVDEGGLAVPDAVLAQQSLVFDRQATQHIEALQQGKTLTLELRFWPTWPSRGRRSVTFDLDGFAPALARLAAGC